MLEASTGSSARASPIGGHREHGAFSRRTACRRNGQQRCPKAGRTSWTPSRTARSARVQHNGRRAGAGRSRSLRRAALLHKVPYYTTLARAALRNQSLSRRHLAYVGGDLEVRALQDGFHAGCGGPRGGHVFPIPLNPDFGTGRRRMVEKLPITAAGYAALDGLASPAGGTPAHHPADRGARSRRPVRDARYHSAKGMVPERGRIAELGTTGARRHYRRVQLGGSTIKFGARPSRWSTEDTEEKKLHQIVGETEADVKTASPSPRRAPH